MHEERGAIGTEVVGYAASSTDEHGGGRVGGDMDENALFRLVVDSPAWTCLGNAWDLKCARFIVSGLPEVDFMGRLAKRQLAERA